MPDREREVDVIVSEVTWDGQPAGHERMLLRMIELEQDFPRPCTTVLRGYSKSQLGQIRRMGSTSMFDRSRCTVTVEQDHVRVFGLACDAEYLVWEMNGFLTDAEFVEKLDILYPDPESSGHHPAVVVSGQANDDEDHCQPSS